MSKLAQDAAAFKSVLHRQDYKSWHSQPPAKTDHSASPAAESSKDGSPKKKRPKTNVVYSQPADTFSLGLELVVGKQEWHASATTTTPRTDSVSPPEGML
ncbi:hypothetical protein ONZ45_g16346 [Pleurotus djamor]|nr:hypothetical protein ONZ45_g16346 [Pleurotus djamor]